MPAAPILSYPGDLARWGIAYQQRPESFMLLIPAVPSLRFLPKSYFTAAMILLSIILFICVGQFQQRNGSWGDVAPPLIEFGIGLFSVLFLAVVRLRRILVFEITASEFKLIPRRAFFTSSRAVWPRGDILEISLNPLNNKLRLRIQGQDTLEFFVSSDSQVAAAIVELLNNALREKFDPIPQPVAAPAPIPSPRSARCSWMELLILCEVLAAILIAYHIWPVVISIFIGVLMVAAIPVGFYFGTQKKDFWI